MSTRQPSLLRLVGGRILVFGLAAMAVYIVVVFREAWRDEESLGLTLIKLQTDAIAEGLHRDERGIGFELPEPLRRRYGHIVEEDDEGPDHRLSVGYHVRVRTLDRRILYTNCGEECTEHFLPISVNPPAFWQRTIMPGKPLAISGGRTLAANGVPAVVEMAVIGDPDGLIWSVIWHEMIDHVLILAALILAVVIGATILSIRAALRPVLAAAEMVDRLDPRDTSVRLPIEGMPREIAHLAAAVNRAFGRIGDLVRAQKLFATGIAHEIRTPVAIVRMELERIDDLRARKALGDLDGLTYVLDQLTALARLETVDRAAFRSIDLRALAEDTVAGLAPYVYAHGKTIEFADRGAARVEAVPSLVENLVRNLVENAVRHTPAGTAISVTAGPGAALEVSDDGPGMSRGPAAQAAPKGDHLGIGLAIVERIAELHRARLTVESAPGRGTRVSVGFAGE